LIVIVAIIEDQSSILNMQSIPKASGTKRTRQEIEEEASRRGAIGG
jgi:hypothetical protein